MKLTLEPKLDAEIEKLAINAAIDVFRSSGTNVSLSYAWKAWMMETNEPECALVHLVACMQEAAQKVVREAGICKTPILKEIK